MNTTEKAKLIDDILSRAADKIGDITPLAMEAYYRKQPGALELFEKHSLGDRARTEGQMIENSVHCLMHWTESPGEIEILLNSSVLHHNDTLHVSPDLYGDLIESTADVIAATIPAENAQEQAIWAQVRIDLRGVIDDCRRLLAEQNAKFPALAKRVGNA